MPWSGEKLRSAVFDADAVLHDQDFLRELADDAKIMGNQNQAAPEPFPDPMELCHNPRWFMESSAVVGSSAMMISGR